MVNVTREVLAGLAQEGGEGGGGGGGLGGHGGKWAVGLGTVGGLMSVCLVVVAVFVHRRYKGDGGVVNLPPDQAANGDNPDEADLFSRSFAAPVVPSPVLQPTQVPTSPASSDSSLGSRTSDIFTAPAASHDWLEAAPSASTALRLANLLHPLKCKARSSPA